MLLSLLPDSTLFNVVAFGTNFSELFFEPQRMNDDTKTKAVNFLKVCCDKFPRKHASSCVLFLLLGTTSEPGQHGRVALSRVCRSSVGRRRRQQHVKRFRHQRRTRQQHGGHSGSREAHTKHLSCLYLRDRVRLGDESVRVLNSS